jgi:ubiquinone/menaquinone biosynthesis C-methylase UbiE
MYTLVPDITWKSVLSLGSGSGEDSNYLKKMGAEQSCGVDISGSLIDIAQASYPDCLFLSMDMEQLDFPDASFDFVYSSLALHYIEDWNQVFWEVWRVLKPDSYFLFSFQHPFRFAMIETRSDENGYEKSVSIIKDRNTNSFKIVGDYLNSRKIESADWKTMTVTTYNKSLGEIFDTTLAAGFIIDQVIEPRPLEQMQEIDLQTYERLNKIPEFMIMRIKKSS